MPLISAVLIVRNEETRLGGCLASLNGVVDEIVVVDTGSTDSTVELARGYTQHCFTFPWCDDFSAARNYALERASGDYALHLDADECIEDALAASKSLRAFIMQHSENTVGTIEIVNFTGMGGASQEVIDHTERFFCRRRFRYIGAIHEQLAPLSGLKNAASTGVRIHHWGYAQEPGAPDHKAHRNKRILQQELNRHPDDEYFLFQLGKAHFSLLEYSEAVAVLEDALSAIRFTPGAPPMGRLGAVSREVLTGIVVTLAYAYVNTQQIRKAEKLLAHHVILAHPGTQRADFHHARGYVYLMLGDVPSSRTAYQEALRYGASGEDVRGAGTFRCSYHLGLLAEADGNPQEAIVEYGRALASKPDDGTTISRCIDLSLEANMALPQAIWASCDHPAFTRLYLDRITEALKKGDIVSAKRLVQSAAALSGDLLAECRFQLQRFLSQGSPPA